MARAFHASLPDTDAENLGAITRRNVIDFARNLNHCQLSSVLIQFIQLLRLENHELNLYGSLHTSSNIGTSSCNDILSILLEFCLKSGEDEILRLLYLLKSAVSVDHHILRSKTLRRNRILDVYKNILLLLRNGSEVSMISLSDLNIILAAFQNIPDIFGEEDVINSDISTSELRKSPEVPYIPDTHLQQLIFSGSPMTPRIILIKAAHSEEDNRTDIVSDQMAQYDSLIDEIWKSVNLSHDDNLDEKNITFADYSSSEENLQSRVPIIQAERFEVETGDKQIELHVRSRVLHDIVLDFARQNILFVIVRGALQFVQDQASSLSTEAKDSLFRAELRRRQVIVESVWGSFLPAYSDLSDRSLKQILTSFEKTLFEATESRNTTVTKSDLPQRGINLWPIKNPFDTTKLFTGFDLQKCSIMRSSKYPAVVTFKTADSEKYTVRYKYSYSIHINIDYDIKLASHYLVLNHFLGTQ